jgi:hypothetical protein
VPPPETRVIAPLSRVAPRAGINAGIQIHPNDFQ